jgi:mannose-6-phosphate isomerase-like protein (cupin superfamily)
VDVIAYSSVEPFTTKDGSTIRELLAPANSSIERQSLAEAQLEPGCSTQAHSHPATEEIYYILSGNGMMAIEDAHSPVGPGDAIAIPAGLRHQIRNTGSVPLVFLCCCVPAYTHADTLMCDPLL